MGQSLSGAVKEATGGEGPGPGWAGGLGNMAAIHEDREQAPF